MNRSPCKESFKIHVVGHLMIRDAVTRELILNKQNAVHPQNMATAIGRSLARDNNGPIYKLSLGNGGTFYSGNTLIYRTPNTVGRSDLYNPTWPIYVDDQTSGTPSTNSVVSSPAPNPSISTIVTVTAQLNVNEPAGQAVADNITTDPNAPFIFDEAGLKTQDDLLLTHIIFNPIEKTANRAFLIMYTLTTTVS